MPHSIASTRPESVGGTPANRMIHRESQQLNIGPYFIDARGHVRAIPPSMTVRPADRHRPAPHRPGPQGLHLRHGRAALRGRRAIAGYETALQAARARLARQGRLLAAKAGWCWPTTARSRRPASTASSRSITSFDPDPHRPGRCRCAGRMGRPRVAVDPAAAVHRRDSARRDLRRREPRMTRCGPSAGIAAA